MKQILAIILILMLAVAGCASLSRAYLYSPSPFERASERAVGADGKRGEITLADIDVMGFADAVEQAWRKRDQAARGIGIAEESAQAGLGAIPIITSLLNFAWPVGPIVSVIGELISKIVGSINPVARIDAYADGIGMLSNAKAEYFGKGVGSPNAKTPDPLGKVPSDSLTAAGAALLKKTNYAIALVEKAIAGRVPTVTEVTGASSEGK